MLRGGIEPPKPCRASRLQREAIAKLCHLSEIFHKKSPCKPPPPTGGRNLQGLTALQWTVPPCFAKVQKNPPRRDCTFASFRLLCFWQHNLSAVTGLPEKIYFIFNLICSGEYFVSNLTGDLAPTVSSLLSQITRYFISFNAFLFTCKY